MQFNYYFLKFLSLELETHLKNKILTSCFSQNKNELLLRFEDDQSFFIIKVNLDGEKSLLSFPQEFARAKRNSVNLFPEMIGKRVQSVRQFNNERCLSIQLEGFELLFKLHGRRANLILFSQGEYHSMFKTEMEQDRNIQLDHLDRLIDQSQEALIDNGFDLKATFPTFDKGVLKYLEQEGFYTTEQTQKKLEILDKTIQLLNEAVFYLDLSSTIPKLSLLPTSQDHDIQSFTSSVAISNAYAHAFFSNYQFSREKEIELRRLSKEIKKAENYIKNTQLKIDDIISRRGYDEIANILMANLHEKVKPGQKSITLMDFYNNQPIDIKLKSKLNLQQNAEVLYRKSKNQNIELNKAEQNLEQKIQVLEKLQSQWEKVSSISDYRELKQLLKSKIKNQKDTAPKAPFLSCEIGGFTVWVGKNAKNNDLLTQKHAKKDDLWLHAKDVSGSHTVIKNPNQLSIPKIVIEQAAELAAWYSKRKSDTLCPVIYTPKKYVRKPKGSLPGQVVVDREQVIMVRPSQKALNPNSST
jgi:predicted ribosome quality control (RQC) complex YloA/Tae2 family protein